MNEHDTDNQKQTGEDQTYTTTGTQDQQGREPSFGQPETGEIEESQTGEDGTTDTLTQVETDQNVGIEGEEATGDSQAGFVTSKGEDSGEYLQERSEKSDDDIEGSSNFATNGE